MSTTPLTPLTPLPPHAARVAGEHHGRARLTNAQARQLRLDYAAGTPTAELTRRYGGTAGFVSQIALGQRYVAAGGPRTCRKPRCCDDETALWIRVVAADLTDAEIVEEFGVSRDMVKRIRLGLSYGWLDEVVGRVWRRGARRGQRGAGEGA